MSRGGPGKDGWQRTGTRQPRLDRELADRHRGPDRRCRQFAATAGERARVPGRHDQTLSTAGLTLQISNPRLSETALLGVTDLYQALQGTSAEQQLADAGNFPPDSGSLLCAAAQASQQPTAGSRANDSVDQADHAAYLVSMVAMNASNQGRLTEGACATLTTAPQRLAQLTALDPANAAVLDFPFTTVTWSGGADDSTAAKVRGSDERDFYGWLTSPAGRWVLINEGLGAPAPPELPSAAAIATAMSAFLQARSPAHILIAIDDSGPMQLYLTQIEAAVNTVLGPTAHGDYLGDRDSFGVWEFPGVGTSTSKTLVPFGAATRARRALVPGGIAGIAAPHEHSAQFNMLTQEAMFDDNAADAASASSVIVLTDGDGYWRADPGGSFTFASVTNLYHLATPGGAPLRVFVIAFGPPGCAESPSGQPGQSLGRWPMTPAELAGTRPPLTPWSCSAMPSASYRPAAGRGEPGAAGTSMVSATPRRDNGRRANGRRRLPAGRLHQDAAVRPAR